VAAIALAVGGAATAGAARLLTGKDIKDASIEAKDLSKKARTSLKGVAGPRGAQGAAGATGATGAAGANGNDATGLTMGSMKLPAANGTYFPPLGGTGGTSVNATEVAAGPSPNKTLTISGMFVRGLSFAGADEVSVRVTALLAVAPRFIGWSWTFSF
jgi:hypothetical protein